MILTEINPEYSFEGQMLKLKLQYSGHFDEKSWLIGKDPDAGKDWGQEEKGETKDEMVGGITDSKDLSLSKLWEIVKDREAWCAAAHGITKTWVLDTEQQQQDDTVGNCWRVEARSLDSKSSVLFAVPLAVNGLYVLEFHALLLSWIWGHRDSGESKVILALGQQWLSVQSYLICMGCGRLLISGKRMEFVEIIEFRGRKFCLGR